MNSLVAFFAAPAVFAFPELVRHGYSQCIACHLSPDGGGILSLYGRSLSNEVVSISGSEKEGQALWGVLPRSEYLLVGGDIRFLQTIRDTSKVTQGRFFLMQADAELAANLERFALVASVGVESSEVASPMKPFSRRHWALWRSTENLSIRAGKFPVAFGIHSPEHRLEMRSGLGWDQGSESYNLEVSILGENADGFVTMVIDRTDATQYSGERGIAVRSSVFLHEKYKLGASLFLARGRVVAGPYTILGFSKRLVLLAELDFEKTSDLKVYGYSRVNFTLLQGADIFLVGETGGLVEGPRKKMGVGASLYPRPHFEVSTQVMRNFTSNETLGWLQLHAYL